MWSPDGKQIYFNSDKETTNLFQMYVIPADGSASAKPVLEGRDDGAYRVPASISPDGRTLIFRQRSETGGVDIGVVELDDSKKPKLIVDSEFDEYAATLSRDGAWLAYASNQSGRDEVYVQPFPSMDRKVQVSSGGGNQPRWSPSTRELFYRNGNRMMVVPYSITPSFDPGRASVLFEGEFVSHRSTNYDVPPDAQSFIMIRATADASRNEIRVIVNWTEELKRLVPTEP